MSNRWLTLLLIGGFILAMIASLVILSTIPARGATVDHIHSSSRYDRSASSLHRELVRFTRRADLITVTEVQARHRARQVHRLRGWGAWTPLPSDVGIAWDRDVYRLSRYRLVPTTRLSYRQWDGYRPRQVAAAVLLVSRVTGVRVLVTNAHLPSGVWRGGVRARVWSAAVSGMAYQVRRLVRRWHPDAVVVCADWNVNLKSAYWRARLHRVFGHLWVSWRRPFPVGGTLGTRLYDGSLTNMTGRARLLRDDGSSDHRPYGEVLRLR